MSITYFHTFVSPVMLVEHGVLVNRHPLHLRGERARDLPQHPHVGLYVLHRRAADLVGEHLDDALSHVVRDVNAA